MTNPLLTAGVLNQSMFQVQVKCKNVSSVAIMPTLYVVAVLEGTFTIQSVAQASVNIGVLSPQDVLDCHNRPHAALADVEEVNGGDFWSGLKSFGTKLHNFIRDHKLISKGLSVVPHPAAQVASRAADAFGYGGVVLGGKKMSRAQMRKRLNQY